MFTDLLALQDHDASFHEEDFQMISRRGFLATLLSLPLAGACSPLRGRSPRSKRLYASISGHVLGRGLRFGRTTEKNPTGRYNTLAVMPDQEVTITRIGSRHSARVRTNSQGFFELEVPGGDYIVTTRNSSIKIVQVTRPITYDATLYVGATPFQEQR